MGEDGWRVTFHSILILRLLELGGTANIGTSPCICDWKPRAVNPFREVNGELT